MTRDDVLEAIRAIAKRTGKAPGRAVFEKETGIKYHEWYGRYWARWGDALVEAGFEPNSLNMAAEKDIVLKAYLGYVMELGRVPTDGELRMRTRKADGFPGRGAIQTSLGSKAEQVRALLEYATAAGAPGNVIAMLQQAASAPVVAEDEDDSPSEQTADGFVYLMKSGKHFKIGRTNTLDRRQYEIGVQLPERLEPVHSIRTDDPSGIEAYWHNRFRDKRLNGEWFKLTADDVRAFKRRRTFM